MNPGLWAPPPLPVASSPPARFNCAEVLVGMYCRCFMHAGDWQWVESKTMEPEAVSKATFEGGGGGWMGPRPKVGKNKQWEINGNQNGSSTAHLQLLGMLHVAHLHLTHVECLGCCAIIGKWCCLAVGWVTSDACIITLAKWDDQRKSAIPTIKLTNFYSDVWFEDSASRPKVIENKMKRISICCKLRVQYFPNSKDLFAFHKSIHHIEIWKPPFVPKV